VTRRAEDVLAEKDWAAHLTKDQAGAIRKYLAGRPVDRSSRVAIVHRADGTAGVVLRTRLPNSNTWREQRVSFDKKGQTIE
jgi:hypothetical protein